RLRPLRHLWLLVAALAFLGAASILVTSRSQAEQLYFIPLIALFAWAMTLYAFAMLFAQVPPPPQSGMRWRLRIKVHLQRAGYWVMAVVMLMVSAFLLLTTWQLATAWRLMY